MTFLKKKFYQLLKNHLITGSFVMVIGALLAGGGNYLYHLLMGRMLGPTDYGILASVISIIYLLSIPTGVICLVIVKYVSALKGKKELKSIGLLFKIATKRILFFSFLAFLLFFVFTPSLAFFLHLNSVSPLVIIGIASFANMIIVINKSILQGLLRFSYFALSSILEMALRLAFAILFVFFGFKINGALLAIVIGTVAAYAFTFIPLRFLLQENNQNFRINNQEMMSFVMPVFFAGLAFTSLFTSDIIMVKHFFPAQQAGFYAALATLGKIIFFVSSPIGAVMFPMVSERHVNGKKCTDLLSMSLTMVFFICFGISAVYFIFPELMIKMLYGSQYLAASPYLGLFAICLSLYSLSSVFINFYLSIKKVVIVILPVLAAIAQIILISFFHQNLFQVIWVSIVDLGLLLLGFLLYYFLSYVKSKKTPSFSYRSCL